MPSNKRKKTQKKSVLYARRVKSMLDYRRKQGIPDDVIEHALKGKTINQVTGNIRSFNKFKNDLTEATKNYKKGNYTVDDNGKINLSGEKGKAKKKTVKDDINEKYLRDYVKELNHAKLTRRKELKEEVRVEFDGRYQERNTDYIFKGRLFRLENDTEIENDNILLSDVDYEQFLRAHVERNGWEALHTAKSEELSRINSVTLDEYQPKQLIEDITNGLVEYGELWGEEAEDIMEDFNDLTFNEAFMIKRIMDNIKAIYDSESVKEVFNYPYKTEMQKVFRKVRGKKIRKVAV